jgi:hypothetical protein
MPNLLFHVPFLALAVITASPALATPGEHGQGSEHASDNAAFGDIPGNSAYGRSHAPGESESYYVEGVDQAGLPYAYILSDLVYDDERELVAYSEEGALEGAQYRLARSDIQYDGDGRQVFYAEEGVDAADGQYSYTRSDIVYDGETVLAFEEYGERAGEYYESTRSEISYDSMGRINAYHEEIYDDEGCSIVDRSEITYDSMGFMTSYREEGTRNGEYYSVVRYTD